MINSYMYGELIRPGASCWGGGGVLGAAQSLFRQLISGKNLSNGQMKMFLTVELCVDGSPFE